ncbi:MAG: hypothetical protein ACLPXT_14725 [Terracidiphilus sp.]
MRDANIEDPNEKNNEEEQHIANTYRVIEPPPESLDDKPTAPSLFIYPDVNAAEVQKPASDPPTPQPPSHESLTERMRRFAENPTRFYATIGVGLGILLGITLAVFLLTGNPEGRNDMGPVISDATGLKGHLYIKWEKTLQYRLTFETIYPEQQAGFALAVSNPLYPLSIEIHLQDAQGVVLCSREIVLKYDARSAAATYNLPSKPAEAIDFTQLDATEQEREQGMDIFHNQIAPNNKVAAINAQGEIPCSKRAYEKTALWSFSTNFPSLSEQDEWLERQRERRAGATQNSAARKKAAAKSADKLLPYSIEGDDQIVEFDINRGVIETSGRKTFFANKTIMGSADTVWQDYPVNIHFRCDQNSNCTLMHAGAGALHVRLRR